MRRESATRIGFGLGLGSALIGLFLYAPIVVVVLYSFNRSRYGTRWTGWTTEWYATLARDPQMFSAALNTILLAALSTGIATVLGTLLGLGLQRTGGHSRLVSGLLYLPVVIPDIVMAVSLLLFYALVRQWIGWFELGLTTMVVAHVTFEIPFVALIVRARLAGLDPAIEEAARDLGANAWQTFWGVTWPLVWPGVLAGALLAFTLSLDDFVVSFFTSGPGATTIPILIYASVKRGVTPEINALSSLLIGATALLACGMLLLQRREDARGTDAALP